ncbi:hypothetical protein KM176_03500 [Pseudooceanicola sp. CBS1P-1]|uniref:Uncharacterized protein n=1 Tax=Pseudooceanicola albus TaxID=2692189 RepID=A0A6L7G9F7_9RHOB|nr:MULTISPECIES: hypothetical protein [Pseudooceanicola]MBT9382918.1 hypothetical protein [Pseudooceanicola endophyticus]MXN20158.1 hypothetical protein [Pseudooceanicola albus]
MRKQEERLQRQIAAAAKAAGHVPYRRGPPREALIARRKAQEPPPQPED